MSFAQFEIGGFMVYFKIFPIVNKTVNGSATIVSATVCVKENLFAIIFQKEELTGTFLFSILKEIMMGINLTKSKNRKLTFTELFLLMRGLKLLGSRRKVIPNSSKNLFMPFNSD